MNRGDGSEMEIEQPMGRYYDPETNQWKSARLNPVEALAAALAKLAANIGEVDGTPDDNTILKLMAGDGGGKRKHKRKRMRGGGAIQNIRQAISNSTNVIFNAAMAVTPTLKEGAKTTGRKLSELLSVLASKTPTQLSQIFPQLGKAAASVIYLLWALVKFGGGGVQLGLGVTSGIINNFSGMLDAASIKMTDQEYQQSWANAISKDWPTAALVSVAALTQAGLLSLTTVVAIILRVFGAAITGPGRAIASVGIYLWYLGKPKKIAEKKPGDDISQEEINKAVAEYYVAAKTAGGDVATAAEKLGKAIAGGVVAAAEKLHNRREATSEEKAAAIAAAGTPTAPGTPEAKAKEAATTLAEGGDKVITAASAEVASLVTAAVGSTEGGVAEAPKKEVTKIVKKARGIVGGRKTRKVSSKKFRSTRRRKPSKYLATRMFAY